MAIKMRNHCLKTDIQYSVFKNAMRAVVEQHGSSTDVPPIKIMITKGRHDMTIKVASI